MDSPSACEAQFDRLPQQVAEERQGMVQLHLFVIESQAKGHRAKHIPAKAETQNPPQGKTQADAVVPEVVKVRKILNGKIKFESNFNCLFQWNYRSTLKCIWYVWKVNINVIDRLTDGWCENTVKRT